MSVYHWLCLAFAGILFLVGLAAARRALTVRPRTFYGGRL